MASSSSDGGPGRYEAFEISQIHVVRCNMLGVCRMCIKSLVDKSAFESITDDFPHLNSFCNIMEHIFSHRIQTRWALFGSGEEMDFWEIIHRFAHPATITSVNDMENILSDLGRGRAWIRLALVQKRLASFVNNILSKQEVLKSIYMTGAFMLSEELTELAGNLRCLDAIDFNLCLKGQEFDFGLKQEINYVPYLKFRQSRSSVMDDTVEEHKLLSQQDDKSRLRELAGGEWIEGDVDSFMADEDKLQSCDELRELVKTERDQKNYFEELVSVRDSQLSRLQSELGVMSAENETQKKNFEAIILELQIQLSALQTELKEHQSKGESKGKKGHNQSDAVTSPTKRASTFLSSLLGD